jgi:ribonuclease Z
MHPTLVNDPFGDPGVFVDFRHEGRAMLFDMGDLANLQARKILRLTHAFVSHTHMDHFCGFDRLVRVMLGRPKQLEIIGPAGFIEKVEHKLGSYTWNLYDESTADFSIKACEYHAEGLLRAAHFRFQNAFQRLDSPPRKVVDDVVLEEAGYLVRAIHLDHRIPCLAFAIEEKQHLNIWRNRVADMGLEVGPWLQDLKKAIRKGAPDNTRIAARQKSKVGPHWTSHSLGELRQLVRVSPGQKVVYVTDIGFTADNVEKVISLAANADYLLIETPFLHEDAEIAAKKKHLTAHQAGLIAGRANVRKFEQFHFSPRYQGQADKLYQEAIQAARRCLP